MDRTRRLWGASLAFALALLAGCDEATGPEGADSEVTVRAYIDADGSGTFNSGDVPLGGREATLTATEGGLTMQQTTGADGVAVFAEVPPGSYRLSFDGDVPAGAVLSTARTPAVVAPFQGEQVEVEFRFAFMPGSISGVLYRDENGNGTFDADVDLPAAGITVGLYDGTEPTAGNIGYTVTDEQGAFSFSGLRPGDYTLEFEPLPTMELVGGNLHVVTVEPQEQAVAPVAFTGNLVSTIAEARAQAAGDGGPVAVRGVVTYQPGFNDEVFVRDETGGIQVFAGAVDASSLGLQRGDTVLVVGTAELRFGEVQITAVTRLDVEGTGPAPEPRSISAEQLNSGEFGGDLAQVLGATVDSLDVLSFGNQFVYLTDVAGNEFGVAVDSRTGVEEEAWIVGATYNVTGVVNYDNRDPFAYQLEVRGPEDVEVAEAPTAIATARGMVGETVTVRGVVTYQPGFNDEIFIQDATAGIQVFAGTVDASSLGLEPGDVVQLTGTVELRFGETQITSVADLDVLGSGPAPAPRVLTAAQLNSGAYAGQLAQVPNATVVSVTVDERFGNQFVTLTDAAGNQFGVSVDSRTGVTSDAWTVGATYDVTGVVNFDSRDPFDYQLEVRGPGDVEPTT